MNEPVSIASSAPALGRLPTRFTELVGCRAPIQLAGLGGGVGTPELAVAVAKAGGLGLVGHAHAPDELVAVLDGLPDVAPGQVGINFLVPFLDPALVDVAASRVRVIDFFYGDPDVGLISRGHAGGALVSWQVGSVDEARAAVSCGCDFVIVQGIEAGGHVRGKLPLLPLLDAVLDAVSVPVLAAGGITTGRHVAAALAAGADGVRIGTRFVTASESGAHPDYVAALLAASGDDTVLTTKFDVDWPAAPHRVLASAIAAAEASDDRAAGAAGSIARWSSQPPNQAMEGDVSAMALYAGAGVGGVVAREPAGAIVDELVAQAAELLEVAARVRRPVQ